MRTNRVVFGVLLQGSLAVLLFNGGVQAEPAKTNQAEHSRPAQRPLSLTNYQDKPVTKETTKVTTTQTSLRESWEIDGPVYLRSADPEPPGELVLKNIFEWEAHKHSDEDGSDFFYEFEVEYGLVENHELIFALPFEIGDGNAEGNGDFELGWHWRLWKENGDLPAFAIRNILNFGTGHDSDGVDYTLRGLFTKTLTPGCTRLHLNPFLEVIDADDDDEDEFLGFSFDDEQEERDFRWGVAIGVDHWLRDNLLLIADYKYENSEFEHARDNHTAELGLDWHIDECQTIGISTQVSLDGDSNGPCVGAKISYMYSFGH